MNPRPSYSQWAQPGRQHTELRIGDAERERAASQLAEHYAVGRLAQDEHGERLDRIWAARTHAELDPVFVDLPSADRPGPATAAAPSSQQSAPRPGRGRRPGRGIPGPLLVALVVLGVVAVVTNFPLILVAIGVWFFFLRGGCGSRSSWRHPRRW